MKKIFQSSLHNLSTAGTFRNKIIFPAISTLHFLSRNRNIVLSSILVFPMAHTGLNATPFSGSKINLVSSNSPHRSKYRRLPGPQSSPCTSENANSGSAGSSYIANVVQVSITHTPNVASELALNSSISSPFFKVSIANSRLSLLM
jgi:hypothetical protein